MRRVGKLAANLLDYLEPMVKPGISTQELNDRADCWMRDRGARCYTRLCASGSYSFYWFDLY